MRHLNLRLWQYESIRAGVVIGAFALIGVASVARAGVDIPELALIGGTGVPGGTVAVTLALSNDPDNLATSGDVDFTYPTDLVEFTPPVTQRCSIDERLADTHQVAGTLVMPGLLRLSILVSGTPVEFPPLGNGDLASCDFHILPAAPTGTAALAIQAALLFDGLEEINVQPVDGAIIIANATPTGTPTVTSTPQVTNTSTATATNTVGGGTPTATNTVGGNTPTSTATATTGQNTATATATGSQVATATRTNAATSTATVAGNTPTVTRTSGGGTPTRTAAPSNEDDGCNIVPTGRASSGGTLALLLAPAILLWARRRRF